jgi:hypothetical protein
MSSLKIIDVTGKHPKCNDFKDGYGHGFYCNYNLCEKCLNPDGRCTDSPNYKPKDDWPSHIPKPTDDDLEFLAKMSQDENR